MYKITHDADSIARQVVPQDFSFLSDADGQIVKALEFIISRVFGVDVSKPVLLGNRVITLPMAASLHLGLTCSCGRADCMICRRAARQ